MRPGELLRSDRPLPLRGRDNGTTMAQANERIEGLRDDTDKPSENRPIDAIRANDIQAEPDYSSPMPPWGSLSCSDLWSEAYESIRADPNQFELLARFEAYVATAKDDTSPDGDLKLPHEWNTLSFTIADKTIVVREVVRKVIKAVTTFKDVISAAISGEPHAALAWAGVMVILPFLENTLQQDEDAANGLEKIVYLLRYGQLQDEVLVPEFQDLRQSESARQLLVDIRSKVIDVYARVYLYEIRPLHQCTKSKARRIVRNAVGADGWKEMWEGIESVSKQIDDGIQSRLNIQTLEIWQKINDSMKQTGDMKDLQQATLACVQDGNQTSLLTQLPCAVNAMFDSAEMGAEESCLRGTQLSVLNNIQDWLEDPAGEVIFWLHGMAGTGKTSISLTAAHALNNRQPLAEGREHARDAFLGATFFFKQGDATRNSTKTFFSTIARRLAQEFPDLRVHIADAVKSNLEIGSKGPQQQLQDLIIRPLLMLNEDIFMQIQLVIAIDALDECIEEKEVDDLVNMLAALEKLHHVRLRILITSRPDNHIFRSFSNLPPDLYRSLVLEKIRPHLLQNDEVDDITRYLSYALTKIANERDVSLEALDKDDIERLREKADGLFIYAATACRFLDTDDFEDDEARREILDQMFDDDMETDGPQQKVDEIYLKVLAFQRFTKSSKTFIQQILGFIAVLFEPVSVPSLGELLSRDRKKLDERLRQLHSVIHIPRNENAPLSLVHLSLRDFLLSEERSRMLPFRVEEISMHRAVFDRCMEIMSEKLHQDMCDLVLPGTLVADVAPTLIEKNVPQYLRYACRYWVDHLERLDIGQREEVGLNDNGKVYAFLAEKLLFWLETISLTQETPTVILILNLLQGLINPREKQTSRDGTLRIWNIETKREAHILSIPGAMWMDVTFALNGKFVATISSTDVRLRIENARSLILSPDERVFISTRSKDNSHLWDNGLSNEIASFAGRYLGISPNSKQIAMVVYPDLLRIIDCTSFEETAALYVRPSQVLASWGIFTFKFSSSGLVGWISREDGLLYLWGIAANKTWHISGRWSQRSLYWSPETIKFSPDGQVLALRKGLLGREGACSVLNVATGSEQVVIGREDETVQVEFHPQGRLIASTRIDTHGYCVISVWDRLAGGESVLLDLDLSDWQPQDVSLAMSMTGKLAVATPGGGRTIRIWDLTDNAEIGLFHIDAYFRSFSFSRNMHYLDSGGGRIPFLTNTTSDEEFKAIQTCLYVGNHWVTQGTDNLVWLPPTCRLEDNRVALRKGTIAFGISGSSIVFLILDLAKTPLRSRIKRL
ncbi:vegetative incompatibility protein HET-E-1 [Colletotrichum musicola]|uniref:Vegetative incompatibility protein HET-E-1 n=1 Tax=Colletotrichum musicola TaxID=2175873 RepID=A0A8H6K533_9PEZI|nr:vegetative incompatibility protein HET-E-1 [Colletotrichum musicola]